MTRKTLLFAAAVLGLAVVAGSAGNMEAALRKKTANSQAQGQSETAPQDVRPTVVQVETVHQGTLRQTYDLPVTLKAARQAQVTAQVAGAFKESLVRAGQQVKKGQLLGRLDAPAARASLAGAESAVTAAEKNLQMAQQELARSQRLVDAGYMASASLDKMKNAVVGAQSQLSSARAQAAGAKAQFELFELRSPFDGTVTSVPVPAVGSQVVPGTPMFTVSDLKSMEIKTAVPYVDRANIADGAPVTVTLEGSDRMLTGKVLEKGMTVNEQNRTFALTIGVNADPEAIPGAFGTAQVEIKAATGTVIPAGALVSEGDSHWVWIAGRDNKVQKQFVKPLLTVDNRTVVSGLSAGVQVVARGGEQLTDGAAIEAYHPGE